MTAVIAFQGVFLFLTASTGVAVYMAVYNVARRRHALNHYERMRRGMRESRQR